MKPKPVTAYGNMLLIGLLENINKEFCYIFYVSPYKSSQQNRIDDIYDWHSNDT